MQFKKVLRLYGGIKSYTPFFGNVGSPDKADSGVAARQK